ncbi:MAG: hypothetical protein J6Y58_05585 [Clostridiales bacterium]|nr:hypothetical protein [Clostridiales bacterium]
MKNEDKLLDAIGMIDEELIPEMPKAELSAKAADGKKASAKKSTKGRKAFWIEIGIAAAAVILVVAIALPKVLYKKKNRAVKAEAVYPEMAKYPESVSPVFRGDDYDPDAYREQYEKWRASRETFRNQPEGYADGFKKFLEKSTSTFAEEAGDENFVYSPLSLYLCMSIVAESADGNTRQEILDLLGVPDIETLRATSKSLFLANYVDDGAGKCLLANSIWMNNRFDYKNDTVERIATEYLASVFSGDPEDEKYIEEFRNWLNRQTDGLLTDYVDDLPMDKDLLLMVASTINYNGKWGMRFHEDETKPGTFHAPAGDVTCDFMNMEYEKFDCHTGDGYTAIELPVTGNGKMRLILPDKDTSAQNLLKDKDFMEFLNNSYTDGNVFGEAMVDLSLPKFDVSYKNDMIDELQKLGVHDAFDKDRGNFGSITDQGPDDKIFVKKVEQDVRVMIDEEGVKGAAITVAMIVEQCAPSAKYTFVFDRPFIFEVFSDTGAPLFVGVVNDPTSK